MLGGRIWVAGGLTDAGHATAKTEFYDPAVGTWGQGPDLPVPLHHAMMVSYQNTVWVIGGFQPQGGVIIGAASARVLHLNQSLTAWVEAPSLHHARGAGAAAVVGNKIVVAGADCRDVRGWRSSPEVFDGTSWQRRRPHSGPGGSPGGRVGWHLPVRRRRPQARGHLDPAAVRRFDRKADRWIQLPAAPGKVSDAGAAIVGGRPIVPGESIGTVFSTVWAYDLASSTWSVLPNLAEPRTAGRRGDPRHPVRHRRRIRSPDTTHPPPPYKPSLSQLIN